MGIIGMVQESHR